MARADGSVKAVHAAPAASTRQTDREPNLARFRSGQKLTQSNQLGIGFLGEPPATNHNLAMEIGKVSDRSAKRGQAQLGKSAKYLAGPSEGHVGQATVKADGLKCRIATLQTGVPTERNSGCRSWLSIWARLSTRHDIGNGPQVSRELVKQSVKIKHHSVPIGISIALSEADM